MGQVMNPQQCQQWVAQQRDAGKTVVTTNGCFDILHVGHLRYLQAARAQGDLLVVAVNSDASVSRLKGPSRPLVPEEERAELLAALTCVDAVVLFEENSPIELLKSLKPNVYVKGDEYATRHLPEREPLEAMGVAIALVPMVAGRSTTSVIEKITQQVMAQTQGSTP